MKKEKPEFIFRCRKCGHLLYASKSNIKNILQRLINEECPNCCEEGSIWILDGEGDFKEEQC